MGKRRKINLVEAAEWASWTRNYSDEQFGAIFKMWGRKDSRLIALSPRHNDNKTFLVWINEEDHLRVISMQKGGNMKEVFNRFCTGLTKVNHCCLSCRFKWHMVLWLDLRTQFSSPLWSPAWLCFIAWISGNTLMRSELWGLQNTCSGKKSLVAVKSRICLFDVVAFLSKCLNCILKTFYIVL